MVLASVALNKALLSSKDPTWQTPDCVLDRVRRIGPIGLDPCTVEENPTNAHAIFTPYDDGLVHAWFTHDTSHVVYVNPPYGRGIGPWVNKCSEAYLDGETVVALLPARPDTRWFPWDANALCFWRGRLKFRGAPAPAPFPSVLAFWGDRPARDRFEAAFQDAGKVVVLEP